MDFLVLAFVLFVLCFLRVQKDEENSLSLDNTLAVRGIMAITIVLHHFSEFIAEGRIFPLLQHAGYLIVSVFFFFSGYGLMLSYRKKGTDYLKGFWKKRILYLFLIYVLDTALYAAYYWICGTFSPSLTIAANSWYLIVQIIFYIVFWVVFRFFGSKRWLCYGVLFAFLVGFCLAINRIGLIDVWYISNFAFLVGIIWADRQDCINPFLKKHFFISVTVALGVFLIFSFLPSRFPNLYSAFRTVSSAAFSALVVLFLRKFTFSGKILKWLGGISLEIYLLHGLVYRVLHLVISHSVLWVLATLACTLLVSLAANQINQKIKKRLQKM